MRKLWVVGTFAALLITLFGAPALAAQAVAVDFGNAPQGTHFVSGTPSPTCTVTATGVTCPTQAFELAGVGNANATATLIARFSATVDCYNPGVNPNNPIESHTQAINVSTTSGLLSPKNGRLTIRPLAATAPAERQFQREATCPNPNWRPVVRPGTVTLAGFTFTVKFQGFGEPAITITGTA